VVDIFRLVTGGAVVWQNTHENPGLEGGYWGGGNGEWGKAGNRVPQEVQ
jgi:hypothetical protein